LQRQLVDLLPHLRLKVQFDCARCVLGYWLFPFLPFPLLEQKVLLLCRLILQVVEEVIGLHLAVSSYDRLVRESDTGLLHKEMAQVLVQQEQPKELWLPLPRSVVRVSAGVGIPDVVGVVRLHVVVVVVVAAAVSDRRLEKARYDG
jgi:hypothetical protein